MPSQKSNVSTQTASESHGSGGSPLQLLSPHLQPSAHWSGTDRFLMTGCKHDEMFCQHRLCHHHLHIFMLTGGVRGQTHDGIELKKPHTASHEMFASHEIIVCALGIFHLWVVTLSQNQFGPTASQKSDHLVHTGTNMWAVSLFWFGTRHKPCTV